MWHGGQQGTGVQHGIVWVAGGQLVVQVQDGRAHRKGDQLVRGLSLIHI